MYCICYIEGGMQLNDKQLKVTPFFGAKSWWWCKECDGWVSIKKKLCEPRKAIVCPICHAYYACDQPPNNRRNWKWCWKCQGYVKISFQNEPGSTHRVILDQLII